jgi:hypothetical protein
LQGIEPLSKTYDKPFELVGCIGATGENILLAPSLLLAEVKLLQLAYDSIFSLPGKENHLLYQKEFE